MTDTTENKFTEKSAIPKWFTIVAVLALIWNLMGVMAFISQVTMSAETMAELPQAEQALYTSIPLWASIAFASAVFGGALASLALLMKKAIAELLFMVSLVAVIVQMFHAFVISNSFAVLGASATIMPTIVVIVAIALVLFCRKAKANNWLT